MAEDIVALLQQIKETLAGSWAQENRGGKHCLSTATFDHTIKELDARWGRNDYPEWSQVMHYLALALYGKDVSEEPGGNVYDREGDIVTWNDVPWRTHAEVLDAMDRAIRLAKEAQG